MRGSESKILAESTHEFEVAIKPRGAARVEHLTDAELRLNQQQLGKPLPPMRFRIFDQYDNEFDLARTKPSCAARVMGDGVIHAGDPSVQVCGDRVCVLSVSRPPRAAV